MKKIIPISRIGKKKAVELIQTSKGAMSVTASTENNENRKFQFNGSTAKDAGLGMLLIKDRIIKEIRTINTQNIKEVRAGGKIYKVN